MMIRVIRVMCSWLRLLLWYVMKVLVYYWVSSLVGVFLCKLWILELVFV